MVKDVTSPPVADTVSLSPASVVTGLNLTTASDEFSRDAATSSEAKARGKETVMDDNDGRPLVVEGRGSDVGTTRRSIGGDDKGVVMALCNTGGDIGPAAC